MLTLLAGLTISIHTGTYAQASRLLDYFPLQTGNRWQYRFAYETCGGQYVDSSYEMTEVLGDTVLLTGYSYKIVRGRPIGGFYDTYLRVDTATGNVYHWTENVEYLYDSLRADVGSTFLKDGYRMTECVEVDTISLLGEQTTGKDFIMYFVFGGEYSLAYGFGTSRVVIYDEDPCYPQLAYSTYSLVYAFVNGHEYGTLVNVEEDPLRPIEYELQQNYPNPFNPVTTIRFSLPKSTDVSIKVFNLLGEEVATLASGQMDPGMHSVQWNATPQPSGVYFYRLMAGDFIETKKLVFLR